MYSVVINCTHTTSLHNERGVWEGGVSGGRRPLVTGGDMIPLKDQYSLSELLVGCWAISEPPFQYDIGHNLTNVIM